MCQNNLINGEKPEFGNPKHIAYLKQQRLVKDQNMIKPSFWTETVTINHMSILCHCGEKIYYEWSRQNGEFEPLDFECEHCDRAFEYNESGEYLIEIK